MPKQAAALSRIPPQTMRALETLGSHLAVARVRRKESLATRAKRIGVSIPTLMRLESGDPSVSMGIYATALWLIGRDAALSGLAAPSEDRGALELNVRQAQSLGQDRLRATAKAKLARSKQSP